MGRKYLILFLVLCGAVVALGQENLDTLWTRRIGGAGNDVFYAMARGNDGNILAYVLLSGIDGLQDGRYILLISETGEWTQAVPLQGLPNISSSVSMRQTESGEIELADKENIYRVARNGELQWSLHIDGRYRHEERNPYYEMNEFYYTSARFWTDSTIALSGVFHSEWYTPWGTRSFTKNYFGNFNLNTQVLTWYSGTSYYYSDEGKFGAPLANNCYVLWNIEGAGPEKTLTFSRHCGGDSVQVTATIPNGYGPVVAIGDNDNYPWVAQHWQPFVAVHMLPGENSPIVAVRASPYSLGFDVDTNNNLVVMSNVVSGGGVRFSIVGSESGAINDSVEVTSLFSTAPKKFHLLNDNTAIVAATETIAGNTDLLFVHTDTIPTGYYTPIPPSVELLVEGPPAWGYRVRSGSSPQATFMFSNLCGEARGRSSGNASGEWLNGNAPFSQGFSPQNEYANTAHDTLWLESPFCNSGLINWQIGDFSGTVNGPMYQTPMPPAVEMLVQGPPAWAYRLRSGTFETSRFVFDNICTRASVALSGSLGDTWSIWRQNSRVALTAEAAIDARNSVDTLWLMSEECLGGTLLWSSDSTVGEIEGPYMPDGPYFPQGFVQQYFCRLEQTGVSVRFAIAGAPDMDALKVWRKPVGGMDSVVVGLVNAHPGQHVILDDEATRGRTYVYYLLATDDFGRIWKVPEASDTIFVDGTVFVPTDYSLSAAYPNPFNAVTKFDYALPNQTEVSFRVYDITGRQVATLVDEFQQPGTYSVVFDASLLSTGIYVYSFEAWNYTAHGKVLLLK